MGNKPTRDLFRLLLFEVLDGGEILKHGECRKYSTFLWNPADPRPILTLSPSLWLKVNAGLMITEGNKQKRQS
jgi:hypothetical protein